MRKLILSILFSIITFFSFGQKSTDVKHIFYLHGRIVELQGINAISPTFGTYDYKGIITGLKSTGAIIHSIIRTENVNFLEFCSQTSTEVDQLIREGIDPKNISVIGASKGAVMAMFISHINKQPINYVLLAANNEQLEVENDWQMHGRVLGIFESTDSMAGNNYLYWIKRSPMAVKFEQLEINTGLGHGFIYSLLDDWWVPTRHWINNRY